MKKLLCLHGMFGKKEDWDFLKDRLQGIVDVRTIDLPGHGLRELKDNTEEDLEYLIHDINKISPDFFLGYSLGGRILYYLQTLELISSESTCIYESSNLVNLSKKEKEDRYKLDQTRAHSLKENPQVFFQQWYSLDLWSFSDELKKKVITDKSQYSKETYHRWAKALTRFSPASLIFPKTHTHESFFIYGSLDKKYKALSKSLDSKQFNKIEIPKAGHNTHLQNPEEFILNLKKIIK